MSHLTVDGRTLTDAERMKVCADMETEDKRLDHATRILQLGVLLKTLRKERNALDARIGNLQGEFDRLTQESVS